jgi:hypothetical protein
VALDCDEVEVAEEVDELAGLAFCHRATTLSSASATQRIRGLHVEIRVVTATKGPQPEAFLSESMNSEFFALCIPRLFDFVPVTEASKIGPPDCQHPFMIMHAKDLGLHVFW